MSYTFSIEGAEYKEEPLVIDGEPVLEDDGSPVMETVCLEPELNMSGLNTEYLLDVLGLPQPVAGYGEWSVAFLPEVRRCIVAVKNGELPSRALVRSRNLVTCGLSSDAVLIRLEILERMAVRAQELGRPIRFC